MDEQATVHINRDWCALSAARLEAVRLSRGWNQKELARQAGISRVTLSSLAHGRTRRPQASTVHRLAGALGVSPAEFWNPIEADSGAVRDVPEQPTIERDILADDLDRRQLFDRSTNTVIPAVRADHPELFAGWTAQEWDELYSTFGTGGQLSISGVRETAHKVNCKRKTLQQLNVLLETHLGDVAANLVASLYRMVCPDVPSPPEVSDSPEEASGGTNG